MPSSAVYSNLPYSTFSRGKPGGSRDVDSLEPDKAAFLGSGYLAVWIPSANGTVTVRHPAGRVSVR